MKEQSLKADWSNQKNNKLRLEPNSDPSSLSSEDKAPQTQKNSISFKLPTEAKEWIMDARKKAETALRSVENLLKEHPIRSVLIGMSTGFVIGMTLGRIKKT